jgi:hypothetical protein
MLKIVDLPFDIFLHIRSFLIVLNFHDDYDTLNIFQPENMTSFMDRESRSGWRNLLSVCNTPVWRDLRKGVMIWSLNSFESERFFENPNFRNYLLHRMYAPSQQLWCRFHYRLDLGPLIIHPDFLNNLVVLCMIECGVEQLPSSRSLQTLILQSCGELTTVGDYCNLQALYLSHNCVINSIGRMENLSVLYIRNATPSFTAFPLFPLENLSELTLIGFITDTFIANCHRMGNLLSLTLEEDRFRSADTVIELPRLPFSSLRSLTVINYKSVDVTGLLTLRSLDSGECAEIKCREEIFPQLTSLSAWQDTLANDNMKDYCNLRTFKYSCIPGTLLSDLSQYENIENVDLFYSKTISSSQFPGSTSFHVGNRTKEICLRLPLGEITLKSSSSCLRSVLLYDFTGNSVAMFQNVSKLLLCRCNGVTDIHAIKNIPYLTIHDCENIQDFSCLEVQRFLKIGGTIHLKNEDLFRFTRIPHIELFSCKKLTKIDYLKGNQYLFISDSSSIQEINLTGSSCIKVEIVQCYNLKKITISGCVYILTIKECYSLDTGKIEGRICHFDRID